MQSTFNLFDVEDLKEYLNIVLFLFHQTNASNPTEEGGEKEKSQEIMPLFILLFDLGLEVGKLLKVSSDLSKLYKTIPIVLLLCQKVVIQRHLLKFILCIYSSFFDFTDEYRK